MGYLVDTTQPLNFEQTKALAKYIKEHGILQFLHLYKKFKDSVKDEVFWGDEIEAHIINIDPKTKVPKLQLNNEYLLNLTNSSYEFTVQPEYGAWMVETVPDKPYAFTGDPNIPLQNFNARRQIINSFCKDGDMLYAGTVFPLLKVGDCSVPRTGEQVFKPRETYKESQTSFLQSKEDSLLETHILTDQLINPHPRYAISADNIRQRRGEKVCILAPIYRDEKTSFEKTIEEPHPGFIHMDQTLFGTGNTSMQVTFGTKNLDEARYLTDQMHVFSSIVLPLSAASAIFKGKVADVDIRWDVLNHCTDCRTAEERDPNHPSYIPKPRWSTVSRYISNRPQCKDSYNDLDFPLDQEMMNYAKEQAKKMDIDIDERMISHLGFIFLRDPLVIFSDKIYVDDSKNTNHFENLQSTNWNNVRFKPPPSFDSEIGWRVELRTIEAQLTADECVAFAMFSFFFAEMVMKREYNFYIPISKVDENIARAHKKDAVVTEKFWFRKNVEKDSPDEWIELTMDEILNGKSDSFIGLFNLIFDFCKEEYGVDIPSEWAKKKDNPEAKIDKLGENMKYFEILSKRARGETPTIAKWMRNFVLKHPKYQKDSIVTPEIAGDLICAMTAISDNEKTYQDFL